MIFIFVTQGVKNNIHIRVCRIFFLQIIFIFVLVCHNLVSLHSAADDTGGAREACRETTEESDVCKATVVAETSKDPAIYSASTILKSISPMSTEYTSTTHKATTTTTTTTTATTTTTQTNPSKK